MYDIVDTIRNNAAACQAVSDARAGRFTPPHGIIEDRRGRHLRCGCPTCHYYLGAWEDAFRKAHGLEDPFGQAHDRD